MWMKGEPKRECSVLFVPKTASHAINLSTAGIRCGGEQSYNASSQMALEKMIMSNRHSPPLSSFMNSKNVN